MLTGSRKIVVNMGVVNVGVKDVPGHPVLLNPSKDELQGLLDHEAFHSEGLKGSPDVLKGVSDGKNYVWGAGHHYTHEFGRDGSSLSKHLPNSRAMKSYFAMRDGSIVDSEGVNKLHDDGHISSDTSHVNLPGIGRLAKAPDYSGEGGLW